ncbi:hypothetical protein E2C01_029810 [Portunus trituberculatus]|uniref:Uncharacterized protein n=1 Tax=Portunus trituberculatus TaxID=210409 RepID=A0A5B7EVJ8_PORTR|nr:hypothetical protein [Portunus trituberculatus]
MGLRSDCLAGVVVEAVVVKVLYVIRGEWQCNEECAAGNVPEPHASSPLPPQHAGGLTRPHSGTTKAERCMTIGDGVWQWWAVGFRVKPRSRSLTLCWAKLLFMCSGIPCMSRNTLNNVKFTVHCFANESQAHKQPQEIYKCATPTVFNTDTNN